MEARTYLDFVNMLHTELVLARGCTEPIAVAYAGAKAREVLGEMPEHCHVKCSGNIVKNVSGVIVPKSEGLRGIDIAAILGIVGGNAEAGLDVLKSVTHQDSAKAQNLLEKNFCDCELVEGVENLYLVVEVTSGQNSASVEISHYHTNITRIARNGEILLEKIPETTKTVDQVKDQLNVNNILEFADTVELEDIKTVLEKQIECNTAIAEEGLSGTWGASVGKTLLQKPYSDSVDIHAAAWAAAGSDARMSGCDLPVVINSGSGNQGITVCMPVCRYAKELGMSHELLLRALSVSNLMAMHQKKFIGRLSAYCGVTSAACAAACGIAYMLCDERIAKGNMTKEKRYQIIGNVITNTLCTIGGMVCDGAKSSCAAKIAAAVQTAMTALDMSFEGRVFQPGEGIVMDDIEGTIASVGRMGREGMKATDVEILNIMLGH